METKHTPGPWAVYQSRGNSRLRVMSDAVPYDVATMNHAGGEEAEAANAALIAAAPELLESLRGLVATLESARDEKQLTAPRFVQCQLREEVKRASAAISKAEGRG